MKLLEEFKIFVFCLLFMSVALGVRLMGELVVVQREISRELHVISEHEEELVKLRIMELAELGIIDLIPIPPDDGPHLLKPPEAEGG